MIKTEINLNGVLCSFYVVLIVLAAILTGNKYGVAKGQLQKKEHRTSMAIQNSKDLWCYHCNTMDAGDRCEKLVDNRTDYHLKCNNDAKMCMVKSISISLTSTSNSTPSYSLWLLERNCTKHCEPGCIVIGERTKLYACTNCCEADFCNSGKSAATPIGTIDITTCVHRIHFIVVSTFFLMILVY